MKTLNTLLLLVLVFFVFPVHAGQTSYYIYDESGHVIGEYDANGNPVQEHIYLGDRPVAVAVTTNNVTTLDYVSTDQLNTPRTITDSNKTVLWSWNSDTFGNGQPTGSLTYNLRFPGQYYDAETGHNYNYYRDYDPATGRYIESDPIGLNGGINTYEYALSNPIEYSDSTGQFVYGQHMLLTAEGAYGSGLSAMQQLALSALVPSADFGTQDPQDAYAHAMCPPGLSHAQCLHLIRWYILNEVSKCDLRNLARAIHAVQDSYASGHAGAQPYNGIGAMGVSGALDHLAGDLFPSANERDGAVESTRELIQLYEKECSCRK